MSDRRSPVTQGRRYGWLAAMAWAAAAPGLASSSVASSCAIAGEGTSAPALTSYLSTDGAVGAGTELIVEVGAAERAATRGVEVWLLALAPAAGWGEGQPALPFALRGAAMLTRVEAGWGETLRWPVPSALFGSGLEVGVLSIGSKGAAFASVALPAADPADPLISPPAAGSVVINEFMKDPAAVSDARGEWLEVLNLTDDPIDVEGWTLRDDGSNSTVLSAGGAGIVVSPGAHLVLGRSADVSLNGGISVDATYSGFTLANGADQIILEAPGGFVIDRVDYLDGGEAGWPDESGASISLSPRFQGTPDANTGASWCAGSVAMPSGDRGTPGAENPDC